MANLTAARAVLFGTVTVAVLDGLYAVILLGVQGVAPDRVFQGIAAGLLGRDAFRGGLATAGLGLALHVFIAFAVVLTYYLLSGRLFLLRSRPLLAGPVYGVLVYAVMNLVVIPLSAGGGGRYSLLRVLGGLSIHVLGVGLPAAYFGSAPHRSRRPAAPSLQTAPEGAGIRNRARAR